MSMPVRPHGGVLVDRFVPEADVAEVRERAARLPKIAIEPSELADLEMIATGAMSPLTGFLGSADYSSVVESMRLADGTVWPIPITLGVTEPERSAIEPGA
jgi:sulfate adenylyltransferase